MRFSPDKKPRRPAQVRPAEVLDLGVPERDIYTFDPEIDIPESVWTSLTTEMESRLAAKGKSLDTMTLRMIADDFIVAPERVKPWRDKIRDTFPRELIVILDVGSPNYDIYLEVLTKCSWLFPERRGEMIDLSPSIFQQMKALVRKEKIDLKDKERALQHLKQLTNHWREINHLRQMCSTMVFLSNFFPNGNAEARKVLREARITPEDLVGELPKWGNKNFRYGVLEALAICFPETRELIREDKAVMTELAQVVRGGVGLAGSDGNYAEAALAFDALTAERVDFDHTGISIRRGPKKKLAASKPIPPRPNI